MNLAITSEIGNLQRVVESLRLKLGKLAEKLDERGYSFISKSHEWQDSEEGTNHLAETYDLEENKHFMFEEQIESLESVIEELELLI